MTLKAKRSDLHRLLDDLPEEALLEVERQLETLRDRKRRETSLVAGRREDSDLSKEFLSTFGSWQDDRSTDEIIEEIYSIF